MTGRPDPKVLSRIAILLAGHGVTDRAVRLEIVSRAADRRVATSKDLDQREAVRVLARIRQAADSGRLDDIIQRATAYVQETNQTTVEA